MITQVEMAMTKDELKKHIDWLVGTLPPFPPHWATKALGELIERHKELDAVEAAIEATIDKVLSCYSPDDTAQDWADKIAAIRSMK